jgi:hypothetical protein
VSVVHQPMLHWSFLVDARTHPPGDLELPSQHAAAPHPRAVDSLSPSGQWVRPGRWCLRAFNVGWSSVAGQSMLAVCVRALLRPHTAAVPCHVSPTALRRQSLACQTYRWTGHWRAEPTPGAGAGMFPDLVPHRSGRVRVGVQQREPLACEVVVVWVVRRKNRASQRRFHVFSFVSSPSPALRCCRQVRQRRPTSRRRMTWTVTLC